MLKLTRKIEPGRFGVIKPGPIPFGETIPSETWSRNSTVHKAADGPQKLDHVEPTVTIGG